MFRIKFIAFDTLFTSEPIVTYQSAEFRAMTIAAEFDVDRIWVEEI